MLQWAVEQKCLFIFYYKDLIWNMPKINRELGIHKSMGECNTNLSADTKYRHLG